MHAGQEERKKSDRGGTNDTRDFQQTQETAEGLKKTECKLEYYLDDEEASLHASSEREKYRAKESYKKIHPLTYSRGIEDDDEEEVSSARKYLHKMESVSETLKKKHLLAYSRDVEDEEDIESLNSSRKNERNNGNNRNQNNQQQIGAFLVRPGNDFQRASSVSSVTDDSTAVIDDQNEIAGPASDDVWIVPTAIVVNDEKTSQNEEDIEARINARIAAEMSKTTNATIIPTTTTSLFNRNRLWYILLLLTLVLVGAGIVGRFLLIHAN